MQQSKILKEQIINEIVDVVSNLSEEDEVLILSRSMLYYSLIQLMKEEGISEDSIERVLAGIDFFIIDPYSTEV